MAIITGTLLEDQYSFVIISRSVLLRMRKVSDKNCRENHNSHFMLNNVFFLENRAVYEIMWKNIVRPDRPLMAIGARTLLDGYLRLRPHTQDM